MDGLVQSYEKVIIAVVTAIATLIATKFVPWLWRGLKKVASIAGRKVSSSYAARDFQRKYLDWVVTEQRELKLTGIVSVDDAKKPTLEQVFVSLSIRHERHGETQESGVSRKTLEGSIRTWKDAHELLDAATQIGGDHQISMHRWELRTKRLRRYFRKREPIESVLGKWLRDIERRLTDEVFAELHFRRILREGRRVAILGGPGAGKSTILQYLALTFARERASRELGARGIVARRLGQQPWRLPIVLRLSSVAHQIAAEDVRGRLTLVDAIGRFLPAHLQVHEAAKTFFDRQLATGRCIVLLDGLDEVPGDEDFRRLNETIRGMTAAHRENQFIITSRIAGWRGGVGSEFDVFYVNELGTRQVTTFIDTWYEAVEKNAAGARLERETEAERFARERRAEDRAADLNRSVQETEGLRRLAVNPMLLSIIALVHRSVAQLPRERSKLYAECSKILLERWDIARGVRLDDTLLRLDQKEAIMRRLAIALHSGEIRGSAGGTREASWQEVIAVLQRYLPSIGREAAHAESLLRRLIERSGIVVERQRGVLAFSHHTFQEYFAAQHLALGDYEEHREFLLDPARLWSDWWREVILLYAGQIPDSSAFVRRIYEPREGNIFLPRLRLAAQCIHESVEMSDTVTRLAVWQAVLAVCVYGAPIRFSAMRPEIIGYLGAWSMNAAWFERAVRMYCARYPGDESIAGQLRAALAGTDESLRNAVEEALPHLDDRVLAGIWDVAAPLIEKSYFRAKAYAARLENDPTPIHFELMLSAPPKAERFFELLERVLTIIPWTDIDPLRVAKTIATLEMDEPAAKQLDALVRRHPALAGGFVDDSRLAEHLAVKHLPLLVRASPDCAAAVLAHYGDGNRLMHAFAHDSPAWSTLVSTPSPIVDVLLAQVRTLALRAAVDEETVVALALLHAVASSLDTELRMRILSLSSSPNDKVAMFAIRLLPSFLGSPLEAEALQMIRKAVGSRSMPIRVAALRYCGAFIDRDRALLSGCRAGLRNGRWALRAAAAAALRDAPFETAHSSHALLVAGLSASPPWWDRSDSEKWNCAMAYGHALHVVVRTTPDELVEGLFEQSCRKFDKLSFQRPGRFSSLLSQGIVVDVDSDPEAIAVAGMQALAARLSVTKVIAILVKRAQQVDGSYSYSHIASVMLSSIAPTEQIADALFEHLERRMFSADSFFDIDMLERLSKLSTVMGSEWLANHLTSHLTEPDDLGRENAFIALTRTVPHKIGLTWSSREAESS